MPDNGLSKLINKIANSSAEDLQKYNNTDFGSNITKSDAGQYARIDYSNASDFGNSKYDTATPIDQLTNNNYQYLRGERQSNWDKAGNGLVNMLGKAGTTAAEGIVNPFYGTIAALTHTDEKGKWDPSLNSYYNNDLTKTLDKINEAVDENNPFYSDKEEATDQGLAKLWHANTIFRDILGGAGTSIGAALTGAAWSKGLSLLGKGLAVSADAAEAAALIEEAKTTGIALAGDKLKFVAEQATKKAIKDGARQGIIALMSATGEAGAEAREAQKNIYNKLTTNPDGSPKQMSEGELEYAKMMSEQAGDAAFGMNLPVIMADNWLTFGKVMFGNKTNDFAKIANKTTLFDEATQTWKAVEKSKYANLGYRAGKIGTPMLSEGNQEMLQHAIGKTAEDYYVNKYYNPNAANFLDSFVKGMKDAYTTQEGWHAGIIGALSAGITSPGIVLATQGKSAFKDEFISNPEDKITAQAVESLNKYKAEDIRKKFVDNQIRQANLAEKKDEAIEANDDFNYHNANEDMIFSYVYNRLQNGKLNETKQEFNNFKDLTVEELKDNYGIEINVDNKASVEAITGKGAVQKFVQDRLDKIAKIEDTYNQVTKLFPNAHPEIKELLTYSAQGLESSKKRTNDLNTQVSDILFGKNPQGAQQLSTVVPGMLLTPFTFAKDFAKMNAKQRNTILEHIQNSDEISPIDKQEVAKKLEDIKSLKERENDFVLTYNALKDPKNAAIFLAASNNLANKFKNIVEQKDKIDEETSEPTEGAPTNTVDTIITPNEHTPWHTNENKEPVIGNESDNVSNVSANAFGFSEPTNNSSELEDKKADIERRRQEEILNRKGNTISQSEVQRRFIEKRNSDKTQEKLIEGLHHTNGDVNPEKRWIDKDDTIFEELIALGVKPDSRGVIDSSAINNAFSENESRLKKEVNEEIKQEGLKRVTDEFRKQDDKQKFEEINAKYDAELAALEETSGVSGSALKDKKADIEKRRQEDLKQSSIIPITNYLYGNSPKEALVNFREYFKKVLAWEHFIVGYNKPSINLDFGKGDVLVTASVQQLAGGSSFINVEVNDVINAKYDAELAALENIEKPVEEVKVPEIKSTSDKHLMLNTPAEARDNQVLYKDKNSVEHLVGEYRNNSENQLASFEEVRKALEFLTAAQDPKKHVTFIEVNGFVMLQVDGINISTISKYGGSPEQKAISALFYNKDGSIKSLEEINNLYQSGVIQLDLTTHLNTLLKDDVKPTLAEVFDMLSEESDSVKLKKGRRETNISTNENDIEFENELSELQSDIAEGLHIELLVDGRVDVIKVKTKTHENPKEVFNTVVKEIQEAGDDSKLIREALDKFNKELFFALEPIKGVVRKFQLNYSAKSNLFYFTLQDKDKTTGNYSDSKAEVPAKLKNIHPSLLSPELVVEELTNSEINANTTFTAKNIRYSDFSNEEGETDTNKLEVYVDPNGLFKYGVQFSINDEAKSLVTTPIQQVPIQTYVTSTNIEAKKADIERRRKEVRNAIQKAGEGEGGQFIVTLLDGTKENAARISLVGNELGIGNKGDIVDLSIIKKVENPDGTILYDAELAALENKSDKDTTTTLTPQSFEDLLKQAQDESNKESDSDFVFSTGLEESTGITSEEIEAVRAILPRFISIEDIKTIANNLKVKGIPYGVFKNKIIYLNTAKGKPGTAYHEAFHAVFRTVLTEQQIHNYLSIAVKQMTNKGFNISEEIDKLVERVPAYISKTDQELAELVLEEYLADEFSKVAQNPKEIPGNIFGKLWFKIKQFFKFISGSNELDMLFDNILKGKFVNSQIVANRFADNNDSVFKLLPKKNSSQDNGFFNASESRKIIGYFAIKIHKAKLSGEYNDLTDEELLDKFIKERITELDTKGVAYGQSLFNSNPEYAAELANKISAEKYLYNKDSINNVKIRPYDVLKSAVTDKLAIFKYKTSEEANEDNEGGEEAVHMKDTFGSQDAWLSGGHDALSQTIKKYVAFTTQIEIDEITNEAREVGVDEVALYNGLTSILADTSEERMIAKLYDAKQSNPNIEAFYEQIIKDLGITFDPETRTTSYPTNAEAFNITRALLTNFKNSKATQIDVLVGDSWIKDAEGNHKVTKANTWVNANKNDAKKISLERWKTKVTFISRQKSIKEFQKNFDKIPGIVNDYYKGRISLDKATQDIDKTGKKGIKELLDENGISLTSIYIKISLAKQKALLNPDKLSTKDKAFISIYDTVEPIDFAMFGSISGSDKFALSDVIDKDLKALFDEKDGVLGRLGTLAENNAKFDESIANFSFTNAEGKKVYEIIKPSYVLSRPELYKKDSYWESVEKGEGLTEVEKKNTYFLRDNYLVTKHKDLLKNLKINILSGFRDTTTTTTGGTKDGVTFGSFDTRTYLVSAISLYYNKGNKETGKYMFRQNEASSTGYVAELPKIDISSVAGQEQMTEYFLTQVTKEWNRIKREKKAFDKKPGNIKKYNDTLKGKAFDFTEFQYLRDTLGNEAYEELVKSALDPEVKELIAEQKALINKGVKSYLTSSFEEFKKIVDSNQIRLFLSEEMKGGAQSYDTLLWEFYLNDYIMSNSLNELMDGDYALSRKDKTDISKRNKGAMASGPDFGNGVHTSAIIKDIDLFTTIKTVNNKIQRVTSDNVLEGFKNIKTKEIISVLPEGVDEKQWTSVKYTTLKVNDNDVNYEVSSYTSNDAMSYSSQYHMMMGAFRLGRVDGATRKTYKNIIQFTKKVDDKIVRNVNIGDKAQKALSEALASLNSKKTIVFDGINGQYLKMSELGFVRSSISYVEDKDVDTFVELTDKVFDLMSKDDYESLEYRNTIKELAKLYKPIPGMEYWHNLANNMDLHGVDHLAVESASKGATLTPQDSLSADLDLSKSKFNVYNSNKRLQVETPTGKKEIVTGSQILTLIASELKDNEKVNGITLGQLRKEYNEAIANTRDSSFKRAMEAIKQINSKDIDKEKLNEIVKRALAASGADEQLLEFFDSSMNYNMVQMIVKAEQVILSHFSKGVLNQKVNGDKVSLVTDAGINVVREVGTGRVVSHHEVVKDPAKYTDKTKYEQSKLRYNVEEGDLKYSECMLSQTILTRHGLKIGDMITPEMTEVLKMLGYRIPTGDKQSAMSLKVVSLLPDYYNGIGLFPSEIVHLSGADFDIDSEFIQMPYFWYKKEDPTVPIKYGSEKTAKDAFEGFKFYNLNYDKDFSRDYKEFLKRDFRYQSLKKAVKQVQADIDQVTGRTKQDLILGKRGLAGQMEIIEYNYYAQVSKKYGLPYTEKQFIAFGKKPNAVLNNEALDRMISMLANNYTAEIANNTTSTDALKSLVFNMKSEGFIKESESKINQENKSASDINGKFDANSKNSAGKNGIGIVANKIQQFAFLMSKVGKKVVKFNQDSFKFEIAGETGGSYSAINKEEQRVADNLNILLNVFTDNAKDPIAGKLNIQFELLSGFTELIMQGMSFENAVKFINLPIIQEYGKIQKALKSKVKTEIEESFNKNNAQAAAIVALENEGKISSKAIELVNKTASKINPEHKEITLKQIENILLGNEFTKEELGDANLSSAMEIQYQALNQFIKVQEQYNVMATLNTFLKLNQGLDTSFTELNHTLHKAIDTWKLNATLNTQDRGLSVGAPHIDIEEILLEDANTFGNIQRALEVSKEVGQKVFIEQTELFTKEFNKLLDNLQDKFSKVGDNISELSREFLGYISIKAYLDELESIKNETNKEAIQKRLDSINLGLIFNELNTEGKVNLVSQLELLKTNPKTKDNYIVKYFTIKENIIDTKSFVKESNKTISLLIDSVKSLYFDNKTQLNDSGLTPRDFVDNMLSYLMVKDNMQFKNNSVAKYLPVNMFGKYSETLDKLITNLITKNTKLNFAELGYNFRKMYVTDINTSYSALNTIKVDSKNNNAVSLNGDKIEFKIDTSSEEDLKKSNATLNGYFSSLPVKNKIKAYPALKFPQFIKVRLDGGEYQIYELESFTNNAKEFTDLKDNFLNYIEASQGVFHKKENPYGAGEKATYKPLQQIGIKNVSTFFPGTYENAKEVFDKVKPKEADNVITKEMLNTQSKELSTLEQLKLDLMKNGVNVTEVKEAPVEVKIPQKDSESDKKVVSLDPSVQFMKNVTKDVINTNLEKIKANASIEELKNLKEEFKAIKTKDDVKALNKKIDEIINRSDSPLNNKC